jgi:hypothetical protein
VALLGVFGWYTYHERGVGRAQIEQQDIASKAVLDSQVKADEQIAQLAADRAAKDRQSVQKQLDDYMATHPIGAVRLCAQNHSGPGLPETARAGSGPADPRNGASAISAVPERDLSRDLDALVRSAATVAELYRSRQQMK